MPCGCRINPSKRGSIPGEKPSFSSGRNTLWRSRRRITIDSPCTGAIVIHALDDALQRRRHAVVGPVDRLDDRVGRAHDDPDAEAGRLREVVDDDWIQRIRGGDRQHAALDAHRADRVLAQVLRREIFDDRQGRRQLVAGEIGEVLLLRERPEHVVVLDGAERDEGLADPLARGPGAHQRLLHDVGGGQPFTNQDLAEPAEKPCDAHAMLPSMLAYLAFVAVAAVADFAGALLVTTVHQKGLAPLRYFVAGGAGFMLAAAFVRMLPESARVPHAFLFVLVGYFGVHLFEHTVAPHFHFGEETHHAELLRPSAGYLAVLGLGVHTLFDGVAIAAGFMIGTTLGVLLFLAVLVHKLPEGFTVASIMLASGHSRARALGAAGLLSALTVVGALATAFVARHPVGYALALSAGVSIYVAASDLIPEVNREGGPALGWTVFGGLVLFAVADWFLSAFVAH